jgi:hypothetical protein
MHLNGLRKRFSYQQANDWQCLDIGALHHENYSQIDHRHRIGIYNPYQHSGNGKPSQNVHPVHKEHR